MAVIENLMEDIAAKLRRDPYEIRTQNCYGDAPRDLTPYGQKVESRLPQILNQIHESSDYQGRLENIRQHNETSDSSSGNFANAHEVWDILHSYFS